MEDYPRYETLPSGVTIDKGKYLYVGVDGRPWRYKRIGIAHRANGTDYGGTISSYQEKFENDDIVLVGDGGLLQGIITIKMGNIIEAYRILKDVIDTRHPKTFIEKCECVMETVNRFFGNYSNVDNRVELIEKGKTVQSMAHKNAALCVERSMLAHQLLKVWSINSTFKISGFINNDGKEDVHAYNLVEDNGKYYIFDSTQPTLRNGIISPIVAEIPKDVYDEMIKPRYSGVSVRVSHYNPMVSKDYDVVYDAGWEKTYDARGSLEQKER